VFDSGMDEHELINLRIQIYSAKAKPLF
jgi:hypothetical protein